MTLQRLWCALALTWAQVALAQSGFVPVAGSKLYYQQCATGQPTTVVLLHDGVMDSNVWDDVWPQLCAHFHTIRYDRRGYGRSPEATDWYSEIDDLAALLKELKVGKAVIVGSSHGSQVSIDFTLEHPDIVQRLVLVGPVVTGMTYTRHFLYRGGVFDSVPAWLARGDTKRAIEAGVHDRWSLAPGDTLGQRRVREVLTASPQDISAGGHILPNKPALPRLGEIHVPTLILVGEDDIPDVHAHAGAIEAAIPHARRIVVEGVGHIMYVEKPVEFSRLVIDFIEQ
jgi:3-oxoadipate enol-lactonase